MNQPVPPGLFAGLRGQPVWLDSTGFRAGLVLGCAALLLGLWLAPGMDELHASADWFPVSLHTLAETFAVVVAMMVFAVSWHAYRPERAGNIIILACGFLAAALLDFAHLMSYQGMPDFITPAEPQKAIAFWLSARLISAAAVLVVAFRPWTPFVDPRSRHAWLATSLALAAGVFWLQSWHPDLWPRFFVPGIGLTPVKLVLEGLVVAMMFVVVLRLLRSSGIEPPYDRRGMLAAALLWILSELALMVYANVNDVFSLLGHAYKVLAFLLIYRLVFVASVREPYERLAEEISRTQAAESQVEALAFYDVLTGLPNKALLRDRVGQGLAAGHVDHRPSALLLLNLDGFKHINDSRGHAYGDAVLRAVAERLPRCVGEADTVARLGSDEFALLLRGAHDVQSVASVQERILAELGQPLAVFGQELRVSASIGASLAPGDGDSFDALFQAAGTALHRAKEAGGNGWRFYDADMNRQVSERLNLRNGLRQGLDRGEFVLHYQPQVDLDTGALVGVEALVRWRHPERGLVPPGLFIPEAEASGLIVPLGQWILREACRQAMAWRAGGLDVPVVAVNLSAKQFQRGDIEAVVRSALAESGLPPASLELELTESILVQDAAAVLEVVRRLRGGGVRLSIDDFGTGYSSLAYLRHFPVDKLKVDQSFVRELGTHDDGEVLVSTIIQLARSLGLETIAEGVEDAGTATRLRNLGCHQAQGYHFARPMPPEDLARFMQSRRAAPA